MLAVLHEYMEEGSLYVHIHEYGTMWSKDKICAVAGHNGGH